MSTDHRAILAKIKSFDQLIAYLHDEMGWPIDSDDFEELTFEYTPDELGIDSKNAAKIQEIKRLRPLSPHQPWGIFFIKFEPKRLPVVALRRILSQVALKKRASANNAERQAWSTDDILFVSNYGEGDERQITFAHFSHPANRNDLPTLKVLGWDNLDTMLHLDAVARELTEKLAWPDDENDAYAWRKSWREAFSLRHREIITTSRELSIQLAKLARLIRDRIKTTLIIETENGPLTKLMKAFQMALVHDLDAEGFADMYAQTIAYGLLSARITDPHKKTADDFANHMRTNPFLRELMEIFLKVGGRRGKAGGPGIDFDELGTSEVIDLLDDANMEAVVRDFGDKNPEEDPVIHFYELFLKEYDAKKRMQRGVFYTPRPVVTYIIRSIDVLLRTEFGLKDGLADISTWGDMAKRYKCLSIPKGVSPSQAFIQILDPACGTGTFLVEIIDLIYKHLTEKWHSQGHNEKKINALWNEYVPKHLLSRLYGYELLMAPYAIAHLKIGLKLYETGYCFGSNERARIYLTNSLEPERPIQMSFDIPTLTHEAHDVNEIKQKQRFTVVIGNPPYAGHSLSSNEWILKLIRDYHLIDGVPLGERNPKWLQDDYVKFIRLSQKLVCQTSVGIVGYITNHSYLDNPTFRGMRRSLMLTFNQLKFFDLHGNSKKKEKSPNGSTDENVFDIQQGVAIFLGERFINSSCDTSVCHSDLWGMRSNKYSKLVKSTALDTAFKKLSPSSPFYLFVPQNTNLLSEYNRYASIIDVFPTNSMGVTTGDDAQYVAFSSEELYERFEDRSLEKSYAYRPFDIRKIYYDPELLARARFDFMRHIVNYNNLVLITIRRPRSDMVANFFVSNIITDKCYISSLDNCQILPLYTLPRSSAHAYSKSDLINIDPDFLKKLANTLSLKQTRKNEIPDGIIPEDIFYYVYAVFHSPSYRKRYSEFLKIDFPRLPIPCSIGLFHGLISIGTELVNLHLMKSLSLRDITTTYMGPQRPLVERVGWVNETVWLDTPIARKGQPTRPGTIGFRDVPEAVWNFYIGGYQVCERWLKDRKGRTLSRADINHFQRIVVDIAETIRLMKEIDEVIEQHGGWPGAFA